MHPFEVRDLLKHIGFWYTYWLVSQRHTRSETLWLIWIAWNMKE